MSHFIRRGCGKNILSYFLLSPFLLLLNVGTLYLATENAAAGKLIFKYVVCLHFLLVRVYFNCTLPSSVSRQKSFLPDIFFTCWLLCGWREGGATTNLNNSHLARRVTCKTEKKRTFLTWLAFQFPVGACNCLFEGKKEFVEIFVRKIRVEKYTEIRRRR